MVWVVLRRRSKLPLSPLHLTLLALCACGDDAAMMEPINVPVGDAYGMGLQMDADGASMQDMSAAGSGGSDSAPAGWPVAGMDSSMTNPLPPAFDALFAPEQLPEFFLTIPPASFMAIQAEPFVYQTGTFEHEGVVIENVGIRLKGRASFRQLDEKAAFKIKFNEFVSGQRFMGLRRLTLNNMVQDPSMVREVLGYAVFRAAGADASMCNHARVYVNGEFYGLYANLQTLDRTFVESYYSPAPGNLYDTVNDRYGVDFDRSLEQGGFFSTGGPPVEDLYELETNKALGDKSDLTALIDAASGADDTRWLADVEALMDVDQLLRVGAVQAIIADWDGYFGATNNYKVYHELGRDRFIMFPWGIDQSLGIQDGNFDKLDYRIDASNSQRDPGILWERCRDDAACSQRYYTAVASAVDSWDALELETLLDDILQRIGPSVQDDLRRPYSINRQMESVDNVRAFLRQRSAIVRSQLP